MIGCNTTFGTRKWGIIDVNYFEYSYIGLGLCKNLHFYMENLTI